jgi:hypothetical protein
MPSSYVDVQMSKLQSQAGGLRHRVGQIPDWSLTCQFQGFHCHRESQVLIGTISPGVIVFTTFRMAPTNGGRSSILICLRTDRNDRKLPSKKDFAGEACL